MSANYTQAASAIIERAGLEPVLLDVGASGDPPEVWRPFACRSTFIGFDPDLRDMRETDNGPYKKSYLVNCAVVADAGQREAKVFLTRSPYCSSTLEPDLPALRDYIFADLFEVEKETTVPAETINSVLARLKIDRLDWIKIDTQGTDLRVYLSISPELRAHILAVDIEPGLIDAYKGEDNFLECHAAICKDGFWLSDLEVQGTVRMRRDTLSSLEPQNPLFQYKVLTHCLKTNPGWVNARYLRTPQWLVENKSDKDTWLTLFAFALIDKSLGFALDLAQVYQHQFGTDENFQLMQETAIGLLNVSVRRNIPGLLRRGLRKIISLVRGRR